MSYASVASHNMPSPLAQPQADPGLSNINTGSASNVIDDTGNKVNVVEPGFKEHPHTATSVNRPLPDSEYEDLGEPRKKKAKKDFERTEHRGLQFWEGFHDQLVRPGVAGGLLGIVNVGLLGTLSYQLYTRPHLRSDATVLVSAAAGTLIILGAEGYLAEAYRNTERGREEERRARDEGAALYNHAKEIVLRPRVFGGLLGVVNLGIIGCVSYIVYDKWDMEHWDRRTVSAVTVGLFSLLAGEGFLTEHYRENEYQKRK